MANHCDRGSIMTGTVLLTFDCEGKWGVADKLDPHYRQCLTSRALDATYRDVLELLRKYRIRATFAFSAAFSVNRSEFARLLPDIEDHGAAGVPWMKNALAQIDNDDGDGWFGEACFEAVAHDGTHEIASHGFSHLPWGASYATREVVDAELALVRKVSGFRSSAVETFVYPRNQVAHTDVLPSHGFRSFRDARHSLGRPANLLRELNVLTPSERFGPVGRDPAALPAGHFLNWRHGLRRSIPIGVTVERWKHMLRHAARNDGVVHAWTHPENFVDGDSMFPLLERLLRVIADEQEAGHLRVVTCRELAGKANCAGREPASA